jgi:Arc/MetJ-type ribon-helix-helix transcriptional regulator
MSPQIAVKLPDRLLREVDDLIGAGGFQSRSHAVRYALEGLVRAERRRSIDEAFARGFTRHPETDEELADATRLAIESIEEEPWEKWW